MNDFAIVPYAVLAKIKSQLLMSNAIIKNLNLDLVDNNLINVHEKEMDKNFDLVMELCEIKPELKNN